MSPAWSGSPDRWANRSPTVTIRVAAGSDSANHGNLSTIGVSQPITPAPASWATTVAATGLDREASWNTVSASTLSPVLVSRTPKPLAYSVFPACTTATAIPGIPDELMRSSARPSSRATAFSTALAGNGIAGRTCGGWPLNAVAGALCWVDPLQAVRIAAVAAKAAPRAHVTTATRFRRCGPRERPCRPASVSRRRRRPRQRPSATVPPVRPTDGERAGRWPSEWAA